MNSKRLNANESSRLNYLRIVVTAAYIGGILSAPRLWFGLGREFPRAPLFNGLPAVVSSFDFLLSILLLAALVVSLITRRTKVCLLVVVGLTLVLVLLDQTRLQPWVYQYVLMLGALAWQRRDTTDTTTTEAIMLADQLMLSLLYFWSGIQKLNWSFGHEVVPGLFERASIHLPVILVSHLTIVGLAVALAEALVGIGLLLRRTRQAAVVIALIMHLLVLVLLFAGRQNSVVWIWNIAMMAMVALLFWRCDRAPQRKELWRSSNLVTHLPRAAIVVCGLAPALSFLGWWDLYLSAAMYSGTAPVAVIRLNESTRQQLRGRAQQQLFTTSQGELMLPLHEWALDDLNVPAYPEVRVYARIACELCVRADNRETIQLIVRERPALLDGSYEVSRNSCRDLLR